VRSDDDSGDDDDDDDGGEVTVGSSGSRRLLGGLRFDRGVDAAAAVAGGPRRPVRSV
jgi:hypothetical protein